MNIFTFVLSVIAITSATALLSQYMKYRDRRRENDTDESTSDMQQKLDDLEDRIRVLERIVTEEKVDLKEQINRL